jgi:hypothetical protein
MPTYIRLARIKTMHLYNHSRTTLADHPVTHQMTACFRPMKRFTVRLYTAVAHWGMPTPLACSPKAGVSVPLDKERVGIYLDLRSIFSHFVFKFKSSTFLSLHDCFECSARTSRGDTSRLWFYLSLPQATPKPLHCQRAVTLDHEWRVLQVSLQILVDFQLSQLGLGQ